ncbi:MAG: helix-turn-helix transcriptional regulator [Bacteroidota bacterium]|nr:helix-turn-helix transcriptional regulator [Bacteroidota bacterium]
MKSEKHLDAFGAKLKEQRLKKDWSQEELAAAAGLDRTYVSSCERGQRNISLLNIYKLANALKIKAGDLL